MEMMVAPLYSQSMVVFGRALDEGREGRVAFDGGVDRRDAVAKPTGTYPRRPPAGATRPGCIKVLSSVDCSGAPIHFVKGSPKG